MKKKTARNILFSMGLILFVFAFSANNENTSIVLSLDLLFLSYAIDPLLNYIYKENKQN